MLQFEKIGVFTNTFHTIERKILQILINQLSYRTFKISAWYVERLDEVEWSSDKNWNKLSDHVHFTIHSIHCEFITTTFNGERSKRVEHTRKKGNALLQRRKNWLCLQLMHLRATSGRHAGENGEQLRTILVAKEQSKKAEEKECRSNWFCKYKGKNQKGKGRRHVGGKWGHLGLSAGSLVKNCENVGHNFLLQNGILWILY